MRESHGVTKQILYVKKCASEVIKVENYLGEAVSSEKEKMEWVDGNTCTVSME